jgi:polyferredoxin
LKNNKYLYVITITYFILAFVNIHFALLGLICMAIPLILLFKTGKKTWCQGYCPRGSLYKTIGHLKKKQRKTPDFFIRGNMKWIVLAYFCISLIVITLSTIKVAAGNIAPMNYLRFLLVIPVGNPPQLFSFHTLPWMVHLSYRFYSMMLTTTTLGLIFGLLYKPRAWCTICPISTVSSAYINGKKGTR